MNIYCNGDSFTAGSGIIDNLLPNFPGYHTSGSHLVKDIDIKWNQSRLQNGTEFFGSKYAYIRKQKDNAWPGQLAKIDSNLQVLNGAVDGASITGIANRTIIDLIANKNIKWDIIFIQLTGLYRFEFYNLESNDRKYMKESTAGWVEYIDNVYEKDIMKSYLKYYKEEEFILKYLYSLVNLRYAIKGLTDVNPIFLLGMKIWKEQLLNIKKTVHFHNSIVISQLVKESMIDKITDDEIMETVMLENNFFYTPCKHYEIRCHEEFSKKLYEKYIK